MSRSITCAYLAHLKPACIEEAIRVAANATGGQVNRSRDSEYRIQTHGYCVKVGLKPEGSVTRLCFAFSRCAKDFWRSFMKRLTAFVQMRRVKGAFAMPASEPRAHGDVTRSVQDVVNQFLADKPCGYEVVFSSKAQMQASSCKYRHVPKFQRVLEGLRRAADMLSDGPVSGISDQDFWNKAFGRAVTLRLSDTQRQMFPEDYQADFDAERFVGHRHVTLGSGWSEADCMSIHWDVCHRRRLIIVVRCGKHGRTHR